MESAKVYYKKTVNYNIGVRRFIGDSDGVLLSGANPVVEVPKEDLRDFKIANKEAFINGLIIEVEEPSIEWETNNTLSDQEVTDLVKNYLSLKNRLPKIDSVPVLYRILEEAKLQDRAKRIVSLIQSRIDELEEEDDFSLDKSDMKGVV